MWVLIDGGMSSNGGCLDPIWNLAYPDMGRLEMRTTEGGNDRY